MKKTLTVAALSSVLVLGLAAASMAADAATTTPAVAKGASKITLDGNIRERGVYDKSVATKDTPGASYYDSRVQLGVKAQVSDQATGYVKLETGADNSDVWYAGSQNGVKDTSYAGGNLMNGGGKLGGLNVLEAWVNYNPGPVGVKAGHMPLALGNKVFFDHTGSGDDAIVIYSDLTPATHVGALTIKFDEAKTGLTPAAPVGPTNSDDITGYVALVTHKLNDNVNLGANWTYLRGGSSAAVAGLSMSNLGVTADGKVGAISYMADGELQFGQLTDTGAANSAKDAKGYAVKLGGDYDFGAGKVGLVYGYGSGKDKTDADFGTAHEDQNQFINFLTDTTYDTIIAEYRNAIPGAGWGTAMGAGGKQSGLSNLSLYQIKGSTKTVCPLTGKDLSILGTLSYMQLNKDFNNYGTNWDKSVGTELDLITTWNLTPGLDYKVEAAYLFVGSVYKTAVTGDGSNPDNLVFLRHSLDLKF